jgi:hypothetical protein
MPSQLEPVRSDDDSGEFTEMGGAFMVGSERDASEE